MFCGCYCSNKDLCSTISVSIRPIPWTLQYRLFNRLGVSGRLDPRTSWLDLWTESCTWHCYFSYLLMANSYRAAQRSFTACRNLAWNVNGWLAHLHACTYSRFPASAATDSFARVYGKEGNPIFLKLQDPTDKLNHK